VLNRVSEEGVLSACSGSRTGVRDEYRHHQYRRGLQIITIIISRGNVTFSQTSTLSE